MPAGLATVNSIMKEVYLGTVREGLTNEQVALKRIEQSSDGVDSTVGGKYVTFPVRVKRNAGIGYRNELEALPAAGQQGYISVRIGLKYGYGRANVSGQVMKLVDKNYQAFASAMDEEMTNLKDDIAKDSNRIVYGDGLGTLAVLTGATTGGVGANVVPVGNSRNIEVGFQVDIVNTTGPVVIASNRQVLSVNSLTSITVDGAAITTAAATHVVVRTGNYGREPNGFASIISAANGTFQNVNNTTDYSDWRAVVDSNAGTPRALSENRMITMTDNIRTKGGKTSLILAGLGVRRSYFSLLQQQRRITDTKTFDGGFTGLTFSNGREIPVVDDPDAPGGQMWFIDESSLKVFREGDWEWDDHGGGVWKPVTGYDAFEAWMVKYWELATTKRNSNGVIQDLIES